MLTILAEKSLVKPRYFRNLVETLRKHVVISRQRRQRKESYNYFAKKVQTLGCKQKSALFWLYLAHFRNDCEMIKKIPTGGD